MQRSLERLRQRRREGLEGGFTLIELLIVIVILAILAAIVVFAVSNFTKQSATAACGSDYKTVESASETFKAQLGDYPGGAAVNPLAAATDSVTPPTGVTTSSPQILELMETWQINKAGPTFGPWLKDYPYNPTHYSISLSTLGVVQVMSADGSATLPASAATGTSADCTAVS